MKQFDTVPIGIIITWPQRFFEDYPGGRETARRMIESMDDREGTWCNTIASIPKIDVVYCYLCFDGFVQYRCNIVKYDRYMNRSFDDGGVVRHFSHKNWITLCAPVIKAPSEIPQKGFQGFRYTDLLF